MNSVIKESIVPPGGWTFKQAVHGKIIEVQGHSLENLFRLVLETRIENGIEVGDVIRDVEEQICARSPTQCRGYRKGAVTTPVKSASVIDPMMDRLVVWLAKIEKDPQAAKLVHSSRATERASICIRCPFNIEWRNACPTCVEKLNLRFNILRRAKNLSCGDSLRFCSKHGIHLGTSVWLVKPSSKVKDQPKPCWVE